MTLQSPSQRRSEPETRVHSSPRSKGFHRESAAKQRQGWPAADVRENLLQCSQFEIAIRAPAASIKTQDNRTCREQILQPYVAAASIWQPKVRRSITCFQCSCAMPEAASSISARTMASRLSDGTCATNSERKASSSALSDMVASSLDLGTPPST
jgi:hypothetical protein